MENVPAERFKEVRMALKLSQKEFSDKLGVSQGTISDIERGRVSVSPKMIGKLIGRIGVSRRWVYLGQGEMLSENSEYNTDILTGKSDGSDDGKIEKTDILNEQDMLSKYFSSEALLKLNKNRNERWEKLSPEEQKKITDDLNKRREKSEREMIKYDEYKNKYYQSNPDIQKLIQTLYRLGTFKDNILDDFIDSFPNAQLNSIRSIRDVSELTYKEFKNSLDTVYKGVDLKLEILSKVFDLAKQMTNLIKEATEINEDNDDDFDYVLNDNY